MRGERLKTLFLEAQALPTAERGAFLEARCAGDAELRREVERLLAAAEGMGRFLERPGAEGGGGGPARPRVIARGTLVGPYKILELIGEGSFGSVYLAEQRQPVVRRVALKMLRGDTGGRDVLARFDAERQALALMDHPNIAKILDAGTDVSGRPYFVMDLVVGRTITEYCDENRLSIRERLELLEQVCFAMQHAHGKGVMHRDVKPSNVLVAERDGRAHATVIDFGIAKATQMRLTERTLATAFRAFVGTPQYMSPEQAWGSPDIDTRTDVYSLGVLMYELLTGMTPFGGETLERGGLGEVLRVIREVEPVKPSTRVAQLLKGGEGARRERTARGNEGTRRGSAGRGSAGQVDGTTVDAPSAEGERGGATEWAPTLEEVARRRRTEAKQLAGSIRELDWIVMKAIEKDRGRRYPTANALGADIRRYLDGLPVSVAPPSTWYWLSKIMARNRAATRVAAVSAALLLAALVGLAALSVQLFMQNRENAGRARTGERAAAEAAQGKQAAEQAARKLAETIRDLEQAQRERDRLFYTANIRLAEASLERGERQGLHAALESCPTALRGWDWEYLNGRADGSVRRWGGHGQGIVSVALSQDGRLIATGGDDFIVRVAERNGPGVVSIDEHTAAVTKVAFTSEGTRLLTVSDDGTARLWNAMTGKEIRELLRAKAEGLWDGALSPDDRWAAFAGEDGAVTLVELTGSVRAPTVLGHHEGGANCVTFGGDPPLLVSGGADGKVMVWDVGQQRRIATYRDHEDAVSGVALLGHGLAASVAGNGAVHFWEVGTGTHVRSSRALNETVTALVAAQDGRSVAVAAGTSIRIIDVATAEIRDTRIGHDDEVTGLAYSPEGTFLVSGSADGTARQWDLRDDSGRWVFLGARLTGGEAALAPDGARVVLTRAEGVEVRDLLTGARLGEFATPGMKPGTARFTPNGRRIVVHAAVPQSNWTGSAVVLDAWTGAVVNPLLALTEFQAAGEGSAGAGLEQGYNAAAFGPAGNVVGVPAPFGFKATLFDWQTGRRLRNLDGHEGPVNAVSFSQDGTMVATAAADGSVVVRRVDGTGEPWKLGGRGSPALGVWFTAGDAAVAVVSRLTETELAVWRVADRELIGWVRVPEVDAAILGTSGDGTRALIRTSDANVACWDVARGVKVSQLATTVRSCTQVRMSADLPLAVGSGEDGLVTVWDLETGEMRLTLRGHAAGAVDAWFTGDGRRIVSSGGGEVRVWDTRGPEERSRVLEDFARAGARVREGLMARLAQGETPEAVRVDVAQDGALQNVERRAALALLAEEVEQRTPRKVEVGLVVAEPAEDALPETYRDAMRRGRELYERGEFGECVKMMERATVIYARVDTTGRRWRPEIVAYTAMARWRLGEEAEARANLDLLRTLIRTEHQTCDCRRFLTTAEGVMRGASGAEKQGGKTRSNQPEGQP